MADEKPPDYGMFGVGQWIVQFRNDRGVEIVVGLFPDDETALAWGRKHTKNGCFIRLVIKPEDVGEYLDGGEAR